VFRAKPSINVIVVQLLVDLIGQPRAAKRSSIMEAENFCDAAIKFLIKRQHFPQAPITSVSCDD
jgi:hypothetical protein